VLFRSKALQLDGPSAETGIIGETSKDSYDEAKDKQINDYEETMRLIKEVTGVSDLQEVIAKFQSQGDTKAHLAQLQLQSEKRIDELKIKKNQVLADLDELKFSSESKHTHSSRLIQEFQDHLKDAQLKMNESKLKYERAARLLENSKAGIKHLYSKLENIHLPDQTKPSAEDDASGMYLLDVCFMKLESILKNTQGKELPESAMQSSSAQPGEQASILQVNQALLPAFNTRVKLRPVEFEEETVDEDDENDDEYGDVPDRESIKRHTAQMLNSRLKSKQSKKIKKKRAVKDE